ncbi:MAG: hypothetical protein KDD78_01950, partial [Caldilineaceae bacterium]|nr:hypothetical protein [Caldilineaceae bacterium]
NEYQAKHLFVLVGKNPLPNVVAIRLLKPADGQVYLVHTSPLAPIVPRICTAAGLTLDTDAFPISINDEKGAQIVTKVAAAAKGKTSLGLNYTGGTKHMVLHAFQGIQQAAQANHVQPVLSYLDGATLSMRIEHLGAASHNFAVDTATKLELTELLALHGNKIGSCSESAIRPEIYPALARLDPKEITGWFQKARDGKNSDQQRDIPLPDIPALSTHWEGCTTVGELADHYGISMQDMGKWFAGHWLEHYTLAAFQQIATECDIHASAMNLKTPDFEFDVVALKGYQLFAVSCVTKSSKNDIKQKLFEAYIRARQMGGDEARVAVVCHAPKHGDSSPRRIEHEIKQSWDVEGTIRIFGEEQLPQLARHLAGWIGKK